MNKTSLMPSVLLSRLHQLSPERVQSTLRAKTGSMKGTEGGALVFVVDDDVSVRSSIQRLLRSARLRVKAFASAEELLRTAERDFLLRPAQPGSEGQTCRPVRRSSKPESNVTDSGSEVEAADVPACVILDVQLPGISGLDLQRRMAECGIEIPIVFITGHEDIRLCVHAVKAGAVEFLTKPFSDQDLIRAVEEGIERNREARQRLPRCSESNGPGHLATQEELNRLAGEVHDGLAQHLSAIHMRLAVAREVLSATGSNPICNIEQAIELVNCGLAEARRCAHSLHSRATAESALRPELQRLAERWSINGRWRCNFNSDDVPESKIPTTAKHQLLRITQEAIQNAARHANPTRITITLRWRAPNLILKITDDGTGIAVHRLKQCEGFGLQNMRRRIEDMGGKLEIQTAIGRGTSIVVMVPI